MKMKMTAFCLMMVSFFFPRLGRREMSLGIR